MVFMRGNLSSICVSIGHALFMLLMAGGDTTDIHNEVDKSRVYDLKKVDGAGCPYTASWLADVNLYRRVTW